jgi:hypothetical protein
LTGAKANDGRRADELSFEKELISCALAGTKPQSAVAAAAADSGGQQWGQQTQRGKSTGAAGSSGGSGRLVLLLRSVSFRLQVRLSGLTELTD